MTVSIQRGGGRLGGDGPMLICCVVYSTLLRLQYGANVMYDEARGFSDDQVFKQLPLPPE